jgi:hypothetical protein
MPAAGKQTSISIRELVEKGFLQPLKRGRPPLYATEEERREAHKAQQRECVKRHTARIKEARRAMNAVEAKPARSQNVTVKVF